MTFLRAAKAEMWLKDDAGRETFLGEMTDVRIEPNAESSGINQGFIGEGMVGYCSGPVASDITSDNVRQTKRQAAMAKAIQPGGNARQFRKRWRAILRADMEGST